jgi:hypothetical protein
VIHVSRSHEALVSPKETDMQTYLDTAVTTGPTNRGRESATRRPTAGWVGKSLAAVVAAVAILSVIAVRSSDDVATSTPDLAGVASTAPLLGAEELAFIQGSAAFVASLGAQAQAVVPLIGPQERAFIAGSRPAAPLLGAEELAFITRSSVTATGSHQCDRQGPC